MKTICNLQHSFLLILFSIFFCANANAYVKVGAGAIVSQIDWFTFTNREGDLISVDSTYENYSFHIEVGHKINSRFTFGFYADKGFGEYHEPSKAELFLDYDLIVNDKYSAILGVGYKLISDRVVEIPGEALIKTDAYDKASARIGVSRNFKKYQIGLWHHSQWACGAPFNDKWEYHKTEITLSYVF